MSRAVAVEGVPGAAAADRPDARWWAAWRGRRPCLRASTRLHRVRYRGEPWLLLDDPLGGEQLRLNGLAAELVQRLDGRRPLAAVLESLGVPLDPLQGPPAGVRDLLLQWQAMGLLATGGEEDVHRQQAWRAQQAQRRRRSRWLRLLYPRIPLIDPAALLARLQGLGRRLFSPIGLLVWGLAILGGLLTAGMHWPALADYGARHFGSLRGWGYLALVYPLVKGVHELAHGLALKAAGGRVHEMGVTLLIFMPIPYVNAREATLLPDRRQRMLVSAAGILAELGLAALALWGWLAFPDGALRELCFSVMTVGGVSTLLFNGNPLLRYDGYYWLCDALDVPNLASRSTALWGWAARRRLLGLRQEPPPAAAPGERKWLWLYAPASLIYRLGITLGIAFYLVDLVPVLGGVLAAWLLVAQWLYPLGRMLHFMARSPALAGRRPGAFARVAALIGGVLLIGFLPLPQRTAAEGIVLMPEDALVRAGAEGLVVEQHARQGDRVVPGQVLFVLSDPELASEVAAARARVAELQSSSDRIGLGRRTEQAINRERLQEAQRQLAELLERHRRLALKAPAGGVLQLTDHRRQVGRFLRQGDLLGYVSRPGRATVRVVARQPDAVRIREGVTGVRVHLGAAGGRWYPARLRAQIPQAIDRLPSAVLGSQGGGDIPVDSRDPERLRTLERVFAFDLVVTDPLAGRFVGRRVQVRFEHPAVPLIPRLYEVLRRMVLQRLQT